MCIRNLLFAFTIASSTSAYATSNDHVTYGYNLLQQQFVDFTDKHAKCSETAKKERLSNSSIEQLAKLPAAAGEGLGFLSIVAINECSQPELSELMRVLLTLEDLNRSANVSYVSDYILTIKKVAFIKFDLYSQKKFDALPIDVRNSLLSMDDIKKPFNVMDTYDRAWGEAQK
ncbi:MAG: hypothetical protein ACI935_000334 [Moritella dasanensis]|jgi:hypothetical protein